MIHPVCYFKIVCLWILLLTVSPVKGTTLHVGPFFEYMTLSEAVDVAVPGDTIRIHEGIYSGGIFVGDLQGTESDWIHIHGAPGEEIIFEGGTNAWQFTDAAYLHISNVIFEHQTGNGVNFDDGGSYETPAHHVVFQDCIFRDMDATGNNDLLKLSGLDSFQIIGCTFMNGAEGGSGIDMVGCHDGLIRNCHFENLGSNSIQAKGGTSDIRIESNFFKNAGARALNLGGSTGLQFFRPIDAPYEAARLKAYSNIFIGSQAPVAFVGSINCEFINNTIYLPEKWVMRILQETVDETRFPACGFNSFRNNIIYIDDRVTVEVNIGPNTAPETFTMSNNLWYHAENNNWTGPVLPVTDADNLVGQDPLFIDATAENFDIQENSPAIGLGAEVSDPEFDFEGITFLQPRSSGAFEGGMPLQVNKTSHTIPNFTVYPNPSEGILYIMTENSLLTKITFQLFDSFGRLTWLDTFHGDSINQILLPENLTGGFYNIVLSSESGVERHGIVIQ